jgi:hypothetical protein
VLTLKNRAAEEAATQVKSFEQDAKARVEAITALRDQAKDASARATRTIDDSAKTVRLRADEVTLDLDNRAARAKQAEEAIVKIHKQLDEKTVLARVNRLDSRLEGVERVVRPIEGQNIDFAALKKVQAQLQPLLTGGRLTVRHLEVRQGEAITTITPDTLRIGSRETASSIALEASARRSVIDLRFRGETGVSFGVVGGHPIGFFLTNGRMSPLTALGPPR